MIVPNELVYNFLTELKRKEINPVERARIIEAYCKETGISIRGLAKELGISKTTLHYWLTYATIEKKDYTKLSNKGFSEPEINKIINSCSIQEINVDKVLELELNILLKDNTIKFKKFINEPKINEITLELIKDLQNTLNRLELHVEKKLKGD